MKIIEPRRLSGSLRSLFLAKLNLTLLILSSSRPSKRDAPFPRKKVWLGKVTKPYENGDELSGDELSGYLLT